MRDGFEYFMERFGVGFDRREVSGKVIEKYNNRLPQKLLEYWKTYGWCGYARGLFWTVNPEDYEPVVAAFLEGTKFEADDTYHVIAKGAFGELYLWGEKTFNCLTIAACLNHFSYDETASVKKSDAWAIEFFFAFQSPEDNDFEGFFEKASTELGALKYDEIYGFFPAFTLGGMLEFKNLKKVKDVEHLLFLAQLAPMQQFTFPGDV